MSSSFFLSFFVVSIQVLQKPFVSFQEALDSSSSSSSLYTYMFVDLDIGRLEANNYIHYLVTNVRGTDLDSGDVNFNYIPAFYFDFDPRR